MRVPRRWDYGNCFIGLDIVPEDGEDEDITTIKAVGARVLNIIKRCVENGGYGGITTVGRSSVLRVFVAGFAQRRPPPQQCDRTRGRLVP